MPRRMTSLSNIADLAISREIDSKYDVVKQVAAKLPEIEQIAGEGIDGLITSLNALDSKVDKVSKQSLDSNSALRVSGTTVSLYKGDGTFDSITTQDTVYTLPTATSTVKGGIEVFSDTVQTVASNTVSTTADRTYGIQLNAAGQAVVNVPWSGTNTTTTVENVLTSTSTTNALSAAQGKVLQDSKVAANAAITAGTGTKVTYDAKGLVTGSTSLVATDIPVLDASKITTGILPVLIGGTGVTTSTGTGNVVLSNSPTLTGTPVAPTAAAGTNTTQIATTAFVLANSGSTQFLGTSDIKGIQYMSQSTAESLTVLANTNAFSIDSFTVENGATITISDGAVYKIL